MAASPGDRMPRHIFSAAALTCIASATVAQAAPAEMTAWPPQGWSVGAGGGVLMTPDYRGSSSHRVRAIPAITARHGDDFSLTGLEAVYTPLRAGPWSAGAQARFRFGQSESDNPAALQGMGGVGASVELGGFAAYGSGPVAIKASLAHDVAGGHGGQVATVSAAYSTRLGRGSAGQRS